MSANGLAALRTRVRAAAVPRAQRGESITLATWNIRAFGDRARREASVAYIAAIISRFTIVSLVELREDLGDLRRVMALLGPHWKAVYSVPVFDPAGNRERSAFLYDSRFVCHTGLASGAQAPRTKKGAEYLAKIDWWRAPYVASFDAGGTELVVLTAHVRWGKNQSERLPELELLADWIALELVKDPVARDSQLLVTGAFNIPTIDGPLFRALTRRGLLMPDVLTGVHGSNLAQDKRYDQVLYAPAQGTRFTGRGGALDFYTGGIRALYPPSVSEVEFTFELSDHLPLWVEMDVGHRRPSVEEGAAHVVPS